jgi:hypothetical protein
MVAASQSKGIFLPYPLLGIVMTIGIVALSGIIALEVQVSNLSTQILLRDADQRAANQISSDKLSTLEVYLHNDRERIIKLEAEKEVIDRKR